jgi:hypothetical protein
MEITEVNGQRRLIIKESPNETNESEKTQEKTESRQERLKRILGKVFCSRRPL